jgi:hypothetical protein
MKRRIAPLLTAAALAACEPVPDPSLQPPFDAARAASPLLPPESMYSETRNAFFGDLHIHTSLSTDAYVMGVRAMPEDAYRFARGGTIEHAAGYAIRLSRPLDFAAVTEHSEYLGQARQAELDLPTTRRTLRSLLLDGSRAEVTRAWFETMMFQRDGGFGFAANVVDEGVNRAAWQEVIDAAERHNVPGRFTTFIGYEWSADGGDISVHMHRNVIFASRNVPDVPFSSLHSNRPEDLWAFLARQNAIGNHALAISHNANLSDGGMYAASDSNGAPLTADYAAMRNRHEPLSEILQIKGSSATHPLLSPLDEFADFEIASVAEADAEQNIESLRGSYMRDALRTGIEHQAAQGFNPFRFGVIGASDSHNASSPVEEDRYHGKLPMLDGSAALRTDAATLLPAGITPATGWGSGGLAGVWAEENTRASLFAALTRKETFATSGPRITVRLFGGWDYHKEMLASDDLLARAYEQGVPMGGNLTGNRRSQAPTFLVTALKDPNGANLDRIQIIKGWTDAQGASHEQVFDVAWSDARQPIDGRLPAVGNTVDAAHATYTNDIGSAALNGYWKDEAFDPRQPAFYYARILEIPTPRWSTYDARVLGRAPSAPVAIQERAITSAIWYQP